LNLIRIHYKKNLEMNMFKGDMAAQSAHNMRNNQITTAAKRILNFRILTLKSILGLMVGVQDFHQHECGSIKALIIYPIP
jgi:hypothetical protein